jgi:phycoerythrin-associated linker protein
MDIKEFVALSEGKWFSQRTSYYFDNDKTENSKADVTIEAVDREDKDLIQLCQDNKIFADKDLKATKISWDNSVDWGKPKQAGSAKLVLIPDLDNAGIGKMISAIAVPGQTPKVGRYILGEDEALTLIVEDEATYFEERQWFASPNFRLRTTVSKNADGVTQTSFYSEIRKAPPKES